MSHARPGLQPGTRGTAALGRGEFFGSSECTRLDLGALVWVELEQREATPVPRHTHELAHVCLAFRGSYLTEAGGAGRAGLEVLFHPAGTSHRDRFLAAGGRCLTVSFEAGWLAELYEGTLPARSTALCDPLAVASALRALHAGRTPDRELAGEIEEAALLLLTPFSARRDRGPARPWLQRARRLMVERLRGPVRVRALAADVGVHPVVLARGFRRHLGCTPLEFLRRARVRSAVARLRSSDAPLAEIALDSGFCDQAQLTRAFVRETGWTPGRLRAELRGR